MLGLLMQNGFQASRLPNSQSIDVLLTESDRPLAISKPFSFCEAVYTPTEQKYGKVNGIIT